MFAIVIGDPKVLGLKNMSYFSSLTLIILGIPQKSK